MAANVQTITLIIDGKATNFSKVNKDLNKTEKNLNEVAVAQTKVATSSKSLTSGIRGMAASFAGIVAGVYTAKVAFDALREAANYDRLISSSQQLSATTGLAYASVAKSMKTITGEAITMEKALQQASLGLSAGLSGTELEKITEVATKAAQALGRDVPEAISRLTEAAVKGSVQMLDELGILINLTQVYKDYAAVIGVAVSELSNYQKLAARTSAITAQGMEKFGAIEIDATGFDKLLATLDEMKKSLLSIVNDYLEPLFSYLANNQGIIAGLALALSGMFSSMKISSIGTSTAFIKAKITVDAFSKSVSFSGLAAAEASALYRHAAISAGRFGVALGTMEASMSGVSLSLRNQSARFGALYHIWGRLLGLGDKLGKIFSFIIKPISLITKGVGYLGSAIAFLGKALFRLVPIIGWFLILKGVILSIADATGIWTKSLGKAADTLKGVNGALKITSQALDKVKLNPFASFEETGKVYLNVLSTAEKAVKDLEEAVVQASDTNIFQKWFDGLPEALADSEYVLVRWFGDMATKMGAGVSTGIANALTEAAFTATDNAKEIFNRAALFERMNNFQGQTVVLLEKEKYIQGQIIPLLGRELNIQKLIVSGQKEKYDEIVKEIAAIDDIVERQKASKILIEETTAATAYWRTEAQAVLGVVQQINAALSATLSLFGQVQGAAAAAALSTYDAGMASIQVKLDEANLSVEERNNLEQKLARTQDLRTRTAVASFDREAIAARRSARAQRDSFDALKYTADDKRLTKDVSSFVLKSLDAVEDKNQRINELYIQRDAYVQKTGDKETENFKVFDTRIKQLRNEVSGLTSDIMSATGMPSVDKAAAAAKGGAGKGGGGGGSQAKTIHEAELLLELAKQRKTIVDDIIDNEYVSFVDRKNAAVANLQIMEELHDAKVAVIKMNMDNAKDALEYARATTALVAEESGYVKDIAEARRDTHDASTAATKMELPDMAEAGRLFGQELQYIWHDMMEDLDNAFTMLANTVMDVFTTATHALSEAIVYGGNDFAEKISDALKQSATQFLDHAFQLLGNMAIQKIGSLVGDVASTATDVASDAATVAAVTTAAATQVAATATSAATIATAVGTGAISITGSIIASTTAIVTAIQVAGITSSIPSFASGGIVTEPTIAMIGDNVTREEAVIPLDSGAVPVVISGNNSAGTNNVTTNIVVNNDGSTNSNTKADGNQGKALGDMINQAVRAVLVNERRSGGLLT